MAKNFNLGFHEAASISADYSDRALSPHGNVWRFILVVIRILSMCKQRGFFSVAHLNEHPHHHPPNRYWIGVLFLQSVGGSVVVTFFYNPLTV